MKTRFLLVSLPILAAAATTHAALMYSGVQNVPIPLDPPPVGLDGVYLGLPSGTTINAFPANWSTAAWINPFFGGVNIANSPLLRPVITGTDQILNLAVGTVIDMASNFVAGESGSSTHVGPASNQFQLGTPGLIGLTFQTTIGGPNFYGWIRMIANNTGPGTIVDWAFESTPGVGVFAGLSGSGGAVPEPATMVVGLLPIGVILAGIVSRRRRVAGASGDSDHTVAAGFSN